MTIGKQSSSLPINDEIRFQKVRLIDSSGEMVGVVPITEARKKAEDQGLDLVLINAQPDNPVCKIMDYGKYMFELSKKEREAKKNQKTTDVKEVGFRLTTEDHDLGYKTRNACRFLQDGDRVKVVVKFRGREMAYTNRGFEVMQKFADACAEYGQIDREPRLEGRNMVMYLAPRKK
ncbi:MAG: translation initiation factor IF-3 [Clostridia bacterium]|nr:translation initiation factor IF-3 [Clostridia bacterium]